MSAIQLTDIEKAKTYCASEHFHAIKWRKCKMRYRDSYEAHWGYSMRLIVTIDGMESMNCWRYEL